MIREELLHPMISHFPIAMFSLALVTKSLELLTYSKYRDFSKKVNFLSKSLIFTAPLFFLITIYLGDIATEIIKSNFCESYLIPKHEELGYYALYFFIGSLIFESLSEVFKDKKIICNSIILLTLIGGNYFLFQTAHLGAKLVYEKGAAVNVAPKCD
jgi:uncharacterized membrane protein